MSINRIFVVADTHFGHRKIAELRGFKSVEEHDRDLIALWNVTVKPGDTVWHLGDVFFQSEIGAAALPKLNGRLRLVMGNHDHYPLQMYLRRFDKVLGSFEYKGCILTHIPIHPEQLEKRYRLNIHGHKHIYRIEDPRYRCVSVEQTGWQPILLNEIIPPAPTTRAK